MEAYSLERGSRLGVEENGAGIWCKRSGNRKEEESFEYAMASRCERELGASKLSLRNDVDIESVAEE